MKTAMQDTSLEVQEPQEITAPEWLENVIERCKCIVVELAKETFNRYREMGKIILESGYQKGQWHNEYREMFLEALETSQSTFSNMVRLGEMDETEFITVSNKFPSYYAWENRGSLAKKAKRERQIAVLKQATKFLPPPQQLYDIIVVDPPWPYGTEYDAVTRRVASPYPEMSIEEIKAIQLPNAENCFLWLWTTNAFMHDAFHIVQAWGFTPRTVLTWAKNQIGVGYWLRGQTEHCILATKGEPLFNKEEASKISTLLVADNKEHSQKPTEFYQIAEKVCSGWKLDYFAREKRVGWDVFGTMEKEPHGDSLHK